MTKYADLDLYGDETIIVHNGYHKANTEYTHCHKLYTKYSNFTEGQNK